MKFNIQSAIPEGKELFASAQDAILLTYVTQVISITSNIKNGEGQSVFPEPKWSQISDNFATSIGLEKAQTVGANVFMLYYDNTPILAKIEGQAVFGLDIGVMGARFEMAKQILEDIYRSIPDEIVPKETVAVVEDAPKAEVAPKVVPEVKKPARKSSAKKPAGNVK